MKSSLQLGKSLLVEAGIAMGAAIASVHERRDAFRRMLGHPTAAKLWISPAGAAGGKRVWAN